jgi:hypothetical protein
MMFASNMHDTDLIRRDIYYVELGALLDG